MPSRRIGRWLLLASVLAMGCGEADNGVQPCDLWTSSALVMGHVTDASGAALGATIDLRVAECDQPAPWNRWKELTTDANGNYSATVSLGNARGLRCVSAAEVGSGTSVSGEVEFVGGCEDTKSPRQLHLD